jgi:hypothetical protein
MVLNEVVARLASLDQEATIYAAEPWTGDSLSVVAREPESGNAPEPATRGGLTYFLEVFIARDFLADWESSLGRTPTNQERCERLIRYAVDDA